MIPCRCCVHAAVVVLRLCLLARCIQVYHPGTIWLGRLDEVDANLVPAAERWQERRDDYFVPGSAPPAVGGCPNCVLVRNDQSADLMLYVAHGMAHDRRTIVLVRVAARHLPQALVYHCVAASRGVHNVLFVTSEVKAHSRLRANGLNSLCVTAFHSYGVARYATSMYLLHSYFLLSSSTQGVETDTFAAPLWREDQLACIISRAQR